MIYITNKKNKELFKSQLKIELDKMYNLGYIKAYFEIMEEIERCTELDYNDAEIGKAVYNMVDKRLNELKSK